MFQLSDPWKDFTCVEGQELLKKIICKQGVDLNATDFMIIFDPYLPAGTTQENLSYLFLGFDFLDEHIDQFQDNPKTSGIYDFWERLCKWLYAYKNELIELNQYQVALKRVKQVIEKILLFHWDLTQGIGILFYSAQLLTDTIGQDLLIDISPSYPRRILENFMTDSDRDCAISLYLFSECHNEYSQIWKEASLVKSIYTNDIIEEKRNILYARWLELGEVSTPGYSCSVKVYIIDDIMSSSC